MLSSSSPRVRKTVRPKERARTTQQGSISSLPAYSELYSPTAMERGERVVLGLGEEQTEGETQGTEEAVGSRQGERRRAQQHLPSTPIHSSTVPIPASLIFATSPSPSGHTFTSSFTPTRASSYTSYHLTSPRPPLPAPLSLDHDQDDASSLLDDDLEKRPYESPASQLDRLLLKSSTALATSQALLSGVLTSRGSLLDLDEKGRQGDDSLSRTEVETRLRTRRDDELYATRIDPLFSDIFSLLSDIERQTPYSFTSHPLRTRLSNSGASIGTIQQVDASYTPSFPARNSPTQHTSDLPSSPNGAPDTSDSKRQPPPQSPATSLLSSLHTRTSSVSSGKSFFLSPPPPSPITRFTFPTPASSPPTQTTFNPFNSSSSSSSSKGRTYSNNWTPTTATFSSPPQLRSSHPAPSLHPSPSLDRMISSTPSSSSVSSSASPSRPRNTASTATLTSSRESANVNLLTPKLPFSSSTPSSISSSTSFLVSYHHSVPELDENETTPTLAPPPRHRRTASPQPPNSRTPPPAFRTSSSPPSRPVSATTTPTMSIVSLPGTNPAPSPVPDKPHVGSAVLGADSAAMSRLRSLGASKPTPEAPSSETALVGDSGAAPKKWGAVSGWFGT